MSEPINSDESLYTPPTDSNYRDHSFNIGTGGLANTGLADTIEPLYAIKAKQLAEASKQKELAISGTDTTIPTKQPTLDELLNGGDGNPETSDAYWRQFGSGTQSLLANTADLATTGGAYIMKGLDGLAGGNGDIYSKSDFNTATNFFDQFSGKNADKTWGYDRTNLNNEQQQVLSDVHNNNYKDAIIHGLQAAPDTLVESLPTILSFFIGAGEVKAVGTAGKEALQVAKASGMSNKAAKAVAEASKVTARKQLAVHQKLLNISSRNAGLINYSNIQTQQQIETLKSKGGEVNALDVGRMWATNVFMNELDKMAFKDIIGFNKAPVSKELWGKLDKPAKFAVTKHIVETLGEVAKHMGEEGLQEYVQTWGETVNNNWGAKDTKNFLDVFNTTNNEQALAALFLGAGAGGALGGPSQLKGLRQGLNKNGKLKKLYNKPKENINMGYATTEDRNKHINEMETNYNDAKTSFENLKRTEDKVKQINEDSTNDNLSKVTKVQKALHENSQATDNATNQLAIQFGNKESKKIIDMISSDENLVDILDEKTVNDLTNSTGFVAFQKLGRLLAENSDKLTPEIKDAYNNALKSLAIQADTIVNSGGTEVSYEQAKKQLNQSGSITKSTSDYAKSKKAPINGEVKADTIGKTSDSKSSGIVKKILGISKPSEAETEMRTYDNATLDAIIKESHKVINTASQKQKTILSDPNLSKAAKLRAQMSKLPEQTKAEQLLATAKSIKAARKKIKKTYSPPKTLKETITDFTKDKLAKLKKAADKVKADKNERKKHKDNKSDTSSTNSDPKDKNRATPEDIRTIKKAKEMIAEVRKDLNKVDKGDIPIIEEALNLLVYAGSFDKKFADKLFKDIKDKFTESGIKDIEVKEVRKQFISNGKILLNKSKTVTRADIKEALNKLGKTIDSKMTLTERIFIAKVFGKAVKMGNLTKEEVKPYLDKLPDNLKFEKTDFTKEKFISLISKTYNDAVNAVKSNSTPEGRQKTEESIKNKVSGKIGNIKDSDLGKELAKDFNTIIANLLSAKKKGNRELKKQFIKFKREYGDKSSLEVYQNVKEIFDDLIHNKNTDEVTEVPDTDINLNKDC